MMGNLNLGLTLGLVLCLVLTLGLGLVLGLGLNLGICLGCLVLSLGLGLERVLIMEYYSDKPIFKIGDWVKIPFDDSNPHLKDQIGQVTKESQLHSPYWTEVLVNGNTYPLRGSELMPMNKTILQEKLNQFTGTQSYHRFGLFPSHLLTDGTKFLADETQSFWLMDIISSYQLHKKILKNPKLQEFQIWKLTTKNDKGTVTCQEDSNLKPIITQKISYTDFPLNEITLYVVKQDNLIIMLPSEY